MSRLFYHVMQDNAGNLLFDVSGTMRLAGTGTVATIYGDEALTVILPNPMTNHPSFGSFKCFLGAGDYDFYMAKAGYTFETLTGVQGHGTMAQQNANAVAITGGMVALYSLDVTGGRITAPRGMQVAGVAEDNIAALNGGMAFGGTNRWNLHCAGTANNYLAGALWINTLAGLASTFLAIDYGKQVPQNAIVLHQTGDTGAGVAVSFRNAALTPIGSIDTTASGVSYNTTSDARLKHAITPLTGAMDVVRALRPITHRWKADDSPGVGFLAHEVEEVVGGVITGDRDAVDEEGRIVPQMIDPSKLVVWLVGAVQTLAAKVASLETQLGI